MSKDLSSNTESFPYPFEELLTASSIVFYHCGLEQNFPILFISNNVKNILGFEPRAFEHDDYLWMERIHPEDRNKVVGAFENVVRDEVFRMEYRFKHGDGRYIWLLDEVKLVRDEQGNPESIVGSSIEITERKEAERQVHELNTNLEKRIKKRTHDLTLANKRLRLLEMAIANINDMVVITEAPKADPLKSEIVFVNEAFEQFTGYSSSEVMGRKPTFLHGEETSKQVIGQIENRISNRESFRVEFINYKKDGTPYWVELDMVPFPAQKNDTMYWVGINRNIDQRKKADRQLKKEKEFIDIAINSLPGLFYVIDENLKFVRTNDNYQKELGYSREELKRMSPLDFHPEDQRAEQEENFKKAFRVDEQTVTATIKKKDGATRTYLFTDKRLKQDEDTFVIGTGIDISNQVKAEQKLKDSLREKETLLAEIHHRVKNNLAIISGLLDLQVFNEENEDVVKKLREGQTRIQSIAMVHEKLYQSESLSRIEMHNYVDNLVEFISGIYGAENTRVTIHNNAEPVSLDIRKAVPCGLILNELITNAYKHAFKGKKAGTININLHQISNTLILEVIDDGIGLPENFDFDKIESLGVTLIQTLATQLNADYTVETDPGSGTSISVSFRLSG